MSIWQRKPIDRSGAQQLPTHPPVSSDPVSFPSRPAIAMILASQGRAFDELDQDTSDSCDYACRPTNFTHNDEPPGAQCVSVGSADTARLDVTDCLDDTDCLSGSYRDIYGDYDILPTILGTGSYGCVRECLHRCTGEVYAVKSIVKANVHRRDHIQREIRLLRAADHPGLLKMVDCYEDEVYVHIVTERCTGGELFDAIVDSTSDAGCLPERRAAGMVKSLLEAVQHLHSRDIVHRDIKAENILFESAKEGAPIKLIDFGLARTHGVRDAAMATPVGTAYYMSPDVLRGNYDRSCDVWAVGVLAYILLSGYPPFNGACDDEVRASTLRGRLLFERGVWERLSATARDFVSKILGDDPWQQISSVEEALQHPWMATC